MNSLQNQNIVITGGTDGIGAATAMELCRIGANVLIIGRSEEKAKHIKTKANNLQGKLNYILSDFSLMKNVEKTALEVSAHMDKIDVIVHAVGILITNTQHTEEGLEKDFAIGYLSRFVFNEILFQNEKFYDKTKIINIAASSPKVPSLAQMEFDDIKQVKARVGMKSHGQAQLANDLYAAIAGKRYNVVSIGYGPGSVDTNIRREVPAIFQILMKPFFYFFTRKPEDVAKQFVEILTANTYESGNSYYLNRNGAFPIAEFINNSKRQDDLLRTTQAIINPILKNF